MKKKTRKKTDKQKHISRTTVEYVVGMDLFGRPIYVTHYL